MLFGVSFCRRCQKVKRRRPLQGWDWRLLLVLLASAVFIVLLFLAPQWLLVLLVLLLTGIVISAFCFLKR